MVLQHQSGIVFAVIALISGVYWPTTQLGRKCLPLQLDDFFVEMTKALSRLL